ncbi:MAG TPA: CoA-binding protein [Bacteroidota bacterium]
MPINDETTIKKILEESRTIAVVGASQKPWRDSNSIARFLARKGYTVYPVNPKYDEINGEKCYPDIKSVPANIDIVDVFRQPSAVPEIVAQAIEAGAKAIWLQYGVIHEQAAEQAEKAGLRVIMDRCIAVDYRQFMH